MLKPAALAAAIAIQPLVSEDVLEPSVQNEVDHALSAAPPEAFSPDAQAKLPREILEADVFGTNGASSTSIAISLVSRQRADGRWFSGTNDVTAIAVGILRSL